MNDLSQISFWEVPFIIVDVETTGSDPNRNRIIDIACVTVQNGIIINEFSKLVNPHQSIPPFISQMTGITYDMVINAPEAYTVFPNIIDLFKIENSVFVAHNARFDYNFVKETIQRELNYNFESPLLCTLKLSKRILPKKIKKNLDSLADYFNLHNSKRHRALGDAVTTANILIEMLDILQSRYDISTIDELLTFQHKQLKQFLAPTQTFKRVEHKLSQLPESPGVYYFLDKYKNILYIGKAKSLKNRVKSYFSTDTFNSQKIAKMFRNIYDIHWVCTNTELESLILESNEIKKHKPPYNTVDKKYHSYPFIKLTKNEDFPKLEITYEIKQDGCDYFGPLRSEPLANEIILDIEKKFKIRKCESKFTVDENNKPCFYYHINKCDAPCSKYISKENYSKEINKIKFYLSGLPNGILQQLHNKMEYYSEKLEFEKADRVKKNLMELKKIFFNDEIMPGAINENNKIVILPNSIQEKTIDVYLIKSGLLATHITIGRKAPLDNLFNKIHHLYFNGEAQNHKFEFKEINEIKIINNWIHRQNGNTKIIHLNGKKVNQIFNEIKEKIKAINFEDN